MFALSCSEYQKALNTDEISVKFNLGTELFDNEKFTKASRLIRPNFTSV
jgi:outer membrane protein assembly factor BamD